MALSSSKSHNAMVQKSIGIWAVFGVQWKQFPSLTPEQWYDRIVNRIGRELDLEDELDDFYSDTPRLSPLNRFVAALETIVLQRIFGHIVLFIDEIDVVRSLPFSADEFFAAIRELYNRRADDTNLSRLTFGLFGVASPSDLIKDARITPFNIGRRIELKDFTGNDGQVLREGLGENANRLLFHIIYWTNGHPYMTQRLCAAAVEQNAKQESDITRIVSEMFFADHARETEDNLKFVSDRLLRATDDTDTVLARYADILKGKRVADDDTDPVVDILKLSGIVRNENGTLKVRNRIYETVFNADWIRRQTTPAETRRQEEAYRAGLQKNLTYAGLIAAGFAVLAAFGFAQAFRAFRNAREAKSSANAERAAKNIAKRDYERAKQNAQAAAHAQFKETQARKRADAAVADLTQANKDKTAALARETNAKKRAISDKEHARIAEAEAQQAATTAKRAEASERKARTIALETVERSDWLLYITNMNLIQQYDEQKNFSHAIEILNSTKKRGGDTFERGYWNNEYSGRILTLKGHDSSVRSVAFSANGKHIVTGSGDNTNIIWNAATGRKLFTFKVDKSSDNSLAISSDGKRILTVSYNSNGKLWNAETGKALFTFAGHGGRIFCAAFSQDGKRVATGSEDKSVIVWDVKTGKEILMLKGHNSPVRSVAFSADGKHIATGSEHKTAIVWDAEMGKEILTLKGHNTSIVFVVFSPEGESIATIGGNETTVIWDAKTGKKKLSLEKRHLGAFSAAFSPNGKKIAIGNRDNTMSICDTANGVEISTFKGHGDYISSLAFSPNGKQIVTGSADTSVILWDATRSNRTLISLLHKSAVHSVAFSADGERFITGSQDCSAVIWDTATFTAIQGLVKEVYGIAFTSVAFSPNEDKVIIGRIADTPYLWGFATGEEGMRLKGHSGYISSVVFSPNGKNLQEAWIKQLNFGK